MADYSFAERVLHRLALGSTAAREASFDLDQGFTRPDPSAVTDGDHVFIAGLARSGTTVLMRAFHDTGRFRSLSYRDMPFPLMPNLWRRLSAGGHKAGGSRERAHGDGVMINFDSPEAFEEVFWMTFAGDAYLYPDRLVPHAPDRETLDRFRRYVATVVMADGDGKTLYLSKNNNNLLRLGGIRRAFAKASIIIPFRQPMAQARSLLEQHVMFSALQVRDPFARRYMTWLGHHEFGLNHRPFVFDDHDRHLDAFPSSTLEYWLTLWTQTYAHLLNGEADVVFVSHEALRRNPVHAFEALLADHHPDLDPRAMALGIRPTVEPRPEPDAGIDRQVLAVTASIFDQLMSRSVV